MRGVDRSVERERERGERRGHVSPGEGYEGSLIGPLVINEVRYMRGRSLVVADRIASHSFRPASTAVTGITDNPSMYLAGSWEPGLGFNGAQILRTCCRFYVGALDQ